MSSHPGIRKAVDVQTESSWIIRQHLAESLQDFFKLNLLTKKPPKTIPPTGKRKHGLLLINLKVVQSTRFIADTVGTRVSVLIRGSLFQSNVCN